LYIFLFVVPPSHIFFFPATILSLSSESSHCAKNHTVSTMVSSPLPAALLLASFLFSTLCLATDATTAKSSTDKACAELKSSSVQTSLRSQSLGDKDYATATRYWNAASGDDKPTCVAFPTNAEEVSEVVKVLNKYTDVEFALKSGGHCPNRGFSSVNKGVLLSFSKLASTTYNADTQTADSKSLFLAKNQKKGRKKTQTQRSYLRV
jgi:hypothetical protein